MMIDEKDINIFMIMQHSKKKELTSLGKSDDFWVSYGLTEV